MTGRAQIVSFEPRHLVDMPMQPSQWMGRKQREALAEVKATGFRAFSMIAPDGRVLFCGGACERVAVDDIGGGYATLWGVFSLNKGLAMVRLWRATCQFIASLPHRRVDAPVIDHPAATRFAEQLGLEFDVRIESGAEGGRDLLIYKRGAQ